MEQIKKRQYVFVLDFEIGYAYRYDVWTNDGEKIEEYLTDLGHNLGNCGWMIARNKKLIK